MQEQAKKRATYEDLYNIAANMTGEIINGELVVTPRPSRRHIYAASALGGELAPAYQFGRGGPGGWVILVGPEIGFGENTLVADLAGWRVERYPREEPHNWISAAPDWVCEIISPGTEIYDRDEKMVIYADDGVPCVWLINPIIRSLEAYKLLPEGWFRFAIFAGNKKARAQPFAEVEIDLRELWGPKGPGCRPSSA